MSIRPGYFTDQAALSRVLEHIEAHDTHYTLRYRLVLDAMHLAQRLNYKVGIRFDSQEPEWPIVFIELPTGQVSWHMPQHPIVWDGHSTEEKYARCRAFREQLVSEGT